MNTGLETVAAYEWLRRELSNSVAVATALGLPPDPALVAARIDSFPLPEGTLDDFIAIGVMASTELKALGGEGSIWVPALFSLVASTVEPYKARAAAIYSAAHQVVEGMFGADDSPGVYGQVLSCERDGGIDYMNRDEDGNAVWTLGGRYRIEVESPLGAYPPPVPERG